MNRPHIYQTRERTVQVKSTGFYEGMPIEQCSEARKQEQQRRIEEQRRIIGDRIRTIKNLAYDIVAGQYVPEGVSRCPDLYHKGKAKLQELGRNGGPEYDRAVAQLKYTWISPKNFKETEALLTK
jgi:hypothetical protein